MITELKITQKTLSQQETFLYAVEATKPKIEPTTAESQP